MSTLPQQPLKFMPLALQAIKRHFAVLNYAWVYVVLGVFIKDVVYYFGGLPAQSVARFTVLGVIVLIAVYLWSCILYIADQRLHDKSLTHKHIVMFCITQWRAIYSLMLLYAVIVIGVGGLTHIFIKFATHIWGQQLGIILLVKFIGALILLNLLGLTYFAWLLVIRGNNNPLLAIFTSYQATVTQFRRIFALYVVVIALIVLLDPYALHAHLLQAYHVLPLFDLLVMAVMLPFIANLTVLVWHDIQLRLAAD